MQPHIEVVYHDSNEIPEEECVNTVISFKVNDKVYQYFQMDFDKALEKFKTILELEKNALFASKIHCVITKFKDNFFIDWKTVEKH